MPEDEKAAAAAHGEKLAEMYPIFKEILGEGWDFEYDPDVEAAGLFVIKMKKWEQERAKGAAVVEQV